jgi:hypothetical protein
VIEQREPHVPDKAGLEPVLVVEWAVELSIAAAVAAASHEVVQASKYKRNSCVALEAGAMSGPPRESLCSGNESTLEVPSADVMEERSWDSPTWYRQVIRARCESSGPFDRFVRIPSRHWLAKPGEAKHRSRKTNKG